MACEECQYCGYCCEKYLKSEDKLLEEANHEFIMMQIEDDIIYESQQHPDSLI